MVLELEVYRNGAVETVRLATHTFTTPPGDDPPNTIYRGLVKDAGMISRSVSLLGAVTESRGGAGLNNADGALDYLYDCGFGRPYRWKELTSKDQLVSASPVISSGIALAPDSPSAPFTEVRLRFRDGLFPLKTPLLTETYAGTTTDGTIRTAEGDEDIKGMLKPLVVTSRANIVPKLVNRFLGIRQVSCLPVSSITVYDGGVAIPSVGDYPTLEAMVAAAQATGTGSVNFIATCFALGLYTPNDAFDKQETADVERGTAADRSAARAAQFMIDLLNEDGAGIEYDEASFDAMHALKPAEVVGYVDAATNVDDLIIKTLGWSGLALDPGVEGVLRVFAITSPAGTPEKTYTRRDWRDQSLSIRANPEGEGGADPNYRAVVQFGGVQTTQSVGDLAGATTAARRQLVSLPFQEAVTPDDATAAAILLACPTSVPLKVETGIRYAADALARAMELRDLFGVRRDRSSFNVAQAIGRKDMGSLQAIAMPRLGYDDGKLAIVLGRKDDLNKGRVTLEMFG